MKTERFLRNEHNQRLICCDDYSRQGHSGSDQQVVKNTKELYFIVFQKLNNFNLQVSAINYFSAINFQSVII